MQNDVSIQENDAHADAHEYEDAGKDKHEDAGKDHDGDTYKDKDTYGNYDEEHMHITQKMRTNMMMIRNKVSIKKRMAQKHYDNTSDSNGD